MKSAGRLAHLCRHPIKSVGYEEVDEARLTEGRAFPGDRRWAVAHEAAELDGGSWVPKMNFIRGVSAPGLMAIRAHSEEERLIHLTHPLTGQLRLDFASVEGQRALLEWLRPLWPANRPAPAGLVAREDGAMTDRPEPFVSILNLASLRDLGERMGRDLSIHRWRGNLWVDGLEPWQEFDLVGQEISIGAVRLKIERRITRCKATTANPETGVADADTLQALDAAFGHRDFGVYAMVTGGGEARRGHEVRLP